MPILPPRRSSARPPRSLARATEAARLGPVPHRPPHRPLALDASHWRDDGHAKVRYPTRADALVAAEDRSRESGTPLGVYECAFCHGWHMGRRTGRSGRLDP